MANKKKEAPNVLTNGELLQVAKNDLMKKDLRERALKRIIAQASKERVDFLALPKEKRVNFMDFGRWHMGEAEIAQMRLEHAQVQRDIEITKEYIAILQENNKK
jgi:hypothetical protein